MKKAYLVLFLLALPTFILAAESPAELIAQLSEEYDINFSSFYYIIECESNVNEKAFNPKDSDGLPKYGIAQYAMGTWRKFVKAFQFPYKDMDVMKYDPALRVTAKAWDAGLWTHWGTCKYDALKRFGWIVRGAETAR